MIKDMTYNQYLEALTTIDKEQSCPIKKTLDFFNGKWKMHVLYELAKKPSMRFGELKKELGTVTNTMLTSTLRELEELGVVYREQFNEVPPHVEYSLTESGKALIPVFFEFAKWVEIYLD